MKIAVKLIILFSIIGLSSCERCEDDIVVADYELTDIAKSYLPGSPMDSLIYTNDNIDITLYTEEGRVIEDTIISLINICQGILFDQQWEVADAEVESIQYYLEGGSFVYEFGIEIRDVTKGDHAELTLDSVFVFEDLFIRVNRDKDQYLESFLRMPINDIQRDWTANAFPSSRIIADTILNNKSYTDLITNIYGDNEMYYSKTEGLVAFEYIGDTWYLK